MRLVSRLEDDVLCELAMADCPDANYCKVCYEAL